MRSAAAVDVLGHRLPLTQGTRHHPVDHVVHLRLDLPRHIGHHVALELVLDPRLVHQVRQASDAQRVVEEAHAAILELVENVVDLRQPELELSREIGAIDLELAIDVVDCRRGRRAAAPSGHQSSRESSAPGERRCRAGLRSFRRSRSCSSSVELM